MNKKEFVEYFIYGQQALTDGFRRKIWHYSQGLPTSPSTIEACLHPLLLKHLPPEIYHIQIYFVDAIDNVPFKTYATVEIRDGYYIAMNPKHIHPG
jgi:hypothetical protein